MTYTITNPFQSLPAASMVKNPRAIVTINDITVKYVKINITTTQFYVADVFWIEMPFYGQDPSLNFDYWASGESYEVKIYIGFPPDPTSFSTQDLELFLVGEVTDFELDPLSAIMTLHGRDLSARMIDTPITKSFYNFTASDVAIMFADLNDLIPKVTSTTQKVGSIFYGSQSTALINNTTQWSFLAALARTQNFVCFAQGEYLVFEPRPTPNNTINPFLINFQPPVSENPTPICNAVNLKMIRTAAVASDVYVTVKVPYSAKTGEAFTVTVKSTHRDRGLKFIPKGRGTRHAVVRMGLTRDQATALANNLLETYTSYETRIIATLPGTNDLKKDSLIQLTGTNSAFDNIYYPDEVTRTLSLTEGYTMQLTAKNKSPDWVNASVNT